MEKIKKLQLLFPTTDSEMIKSVFFQTGDNFTITVNTLKEYGFAQAREVAEPRAEVRVAEPQSPVQDSEPESLSPQRLSDREYQRAMEEMQRQRQLMELYFQTASKMAAAHTWQQAKKLSDEGRKHQQRFEDLYRKTFRETFRRTNEKGDGRTSIDLHGLRVQEALDILDEYLDHAMASARMNGSQSAKLEVITGRGVHSVRNIPILKPAVEKHLRELGHRFSELEGGFIVSLT